MWTFKDYDRELIWLSPRWAVAGSTHAHYGASTRQGAYLFQQRIELSVQGCAAALRCHTGQAFPRHHPLHRETSHPAGAEGGSEGTAQRPGAACPGPAPSLVPLSSQARHMLAARCQRAGGARLRFSFSLIVGQSDTQNQNLGFLSEKERRMDGVGTSAVSRKWAHAGAGENLGDVLSHPLSTEKVQSRM